ncbi:centromere-associated protein E-like [Pieris napi]|uniref:centromere-associated protein E-like n=1 Tax=Pieris napi TaxID=78633 RepID=UPI001FBB27E5|nr:centromere-associated protein E-like [Pieris napi]
MDKKQQLLNHESYLLKEIEHYEKRIKEALENEKSKATYIESDSSDLEYELKINNESSLLDLKLEKKQLKTCYLATAELADVTIVQSEMNILPEDPEFDGVPITEPGVWKEVMAECRIGMVPFSISFFSHQASRPFAPIAFRNLQVLPIKKPQELELSKSVLPRLTRPSDTILTLRSYENAYRSRRTTLANLSDKYGDFLSLEAKADGGYILKCDEILNMTWLLQNKNSHLTRFQHRMSFDLEYIDESYVKIVRKANKKLENQSIQTEERTQLLAAIIDACLQAKASLESQSESENDRVTETPQTDENIMAPPKTIPKKSKKASPRPAVVENSLKKAKTLKANVNSKKDITADSKNVPPTNKNTDDARTELISNENVERVYNIQGKEQSKVNVASEKDIQTTDATIKSVNVTNKKKIQIIEDIIIKPGNSNLENKKRKLDATEKIPVKKIKSNVENRKENVNMDSRKTNTDKTDKVTEKQNSNTNLATKNNDKPKKDNENKEININGSNGIEQLQKKVEKQIGPKITKEVQKVSTNTQNKEKTGKITLNKPGNSQKIIGLQKENPRNSNKITEVMHVKMGKTNKIGNTQKHKPVTQKVNENTKSGNPKAQNYNKDKGNTPSKEQGEKRKSLGSGGKSKIPQKKPEFKNPQTGKIKPSSLLVKTKPTNIPIVKRP